MRNQDPGNFLCTAEILCTIFDFIYSENISKWLRPRTSTTIVHVQLWKGEVAETAVTVIGTTIRRAASRAAMTVLLPTVLAEPAHRQ